MLKMRLQRVGRVHEPSFRLVLTDSQNSTKSGRFKEILGSYDPRRSEDSLNNERIKYWLSQGVTPTATVHNLLVKHKIINAKKIDVSAVSKKKTPVPAGVNESEVKSTDSPEASPEPEAVSQEESTPPAENESVGVTSPEGADVQAENGLAEESVEEKV